jgi:uncharacterized protein (TIGR03437 family)
MMRPLAALLILNSILPIAVYADDWPMYLADLAHTSFRANETQINPGNVSQLAQLWKISAGAPVASGVTVSNGFLFVGDWAGNFRAVNASTGAVVWTRFLGVAPNPAQSGCMPGVGVSAQSVVNGQTVYAAGGDSAIYAMDRNTGAIQWRVALADPQTGSYLWSSLSIYQNALYIGMASLTDCPLVRGGLARIPLNNPANPQIQYFVPAGMTGAGLWSTPAIDTQNNLVYLTTGNADASLQDASRGIWGSALLVLDATTLAIKAHFFLPFVPQDTDADWGSSPLLFSSGGQPYVAANGKTGAMWVLHRPDLTPVWSYQLATDCDSPTQGCGSVSTPAFDGNLLITGAGQPAGANMPPGTVYGFDPVAQRLVWMYAARGVVVAPVTLTPGLVFVSSESGLAVLDETSGAELWNDGEAVGVYSQPVVSNGVLYATYINGDVIAWGLPGGLGTSELSATPASLQFWYTSGGAVPAAQTVALETVVSGLNFTAVSDSVWLTAEMASGLTPATIAVNASPAGMAAGVYRGTITLTSADGSLVTVSVSMVVNPALPALGAAQVANAASGRGGIAPGSLFSIFAASLSADTTGAGAPWTTSWEGISVKINGIAAPLAYVGPTQINAQLPYETAPGNAVLTIESNGVTSAPVTLAVAAAAPGIFVDSAGRAAALNQDYSQNQAGDPAPVGSVVAVYFTGQGALAQPVATGVATPQDPLSPTVAATTATLGGMPTTVWFSGLAPGLIGVAQANLQIPNLPAGDYPVVLTVGGASSNAGIISIGSR